VLLSDIDLRGGLQEAWHDVATIVPKLLAFFVILLLGWLIAKALSKLTNSLLERVGFDDWVERGSLRQAFERSRTDASDIVALLVFWVVFLIALQLAFGIWGPNPISDLLTRVIAFLPNVFVAIVLVVVSAAIAAAVRTVVQGAIGGLSYGRMLANLASVAIILVGVFAALNQLQIAPVIVNGLFYAILATFVGVTIVGVGGGLIVPMRTRWENALNRVETEVPRIQQHVQAKQSEVLTPKQTGYIS